MRLYLSPPTVLIVDDHELFRRSAAAALRRAGYRVEEAENGLSAWRLLRQGAAPAVILLDLLMPVMDGWQLRERLTAAPELCEIPVIITTALGEEYQRANQLRAAAYVPKPCPARKVVRVVEDLCPLAFPHLRVPAEEEPPVGVG